MNSKWELCNGILAYSYPQVRFVMSDKTNLSDLLSLNLHNFEDEVRTIVDKATKELSMEKTLKVIYMQSNMFTISILVLRLCAC